MRMNQSVRLSIKQSFRLSCLACLAHYSRPSEEEPAQTKPRPATAMAKSSGGSKKKSGGGKKKNPVAAPPDSGGGSSKKQKKANRHLQGGKKTKKRSSSAGPGGGAGKGRGSSVGVTPTCVVAGGAAAKTACADRRPWEGRGGRWLRADVTHLRFQAFAQDDGVANAWCAAGLRESGTCASRFRHVEPLGSP